MRWLIALIVGWATLSHAGTKRVAIVVGTNIGSASQPLRYAETDAEKFARVLTEPGGVEPDDLFLLRGKTMAALTDAFARVKRRIAGFRADPTNRIIVLFYFSGHSDGEALEIGGDRLILEPAGGLRPQAPTFGSRSSIVARAGHCGEGRHARASPS